MRDINNIINANPYLNTVFLVLAILGITMSIVLYLLSIRRKKPMYRNSSYRLIGQPFKEIEGLEISYYGRKIDNMVLSKVSIWNAGKDPINSVDIAPKDQIRLVVLEGELLGAQIEYEHNKTNNFSINTKEIPNTIIVNFDYFGLNEGILLRVYHNSESDNSIKIRGTVKGHGELQLAKDDSYYTGRYIDLIIKIFKSIASVRFKWLRKLLFVISIMVLLPIIILPLMFLQAMDLLLFRLVKNIPKQYRV